MNTGERTQVVSDGWGGPDHVVIVDADENCRRMYSMMLAHHGYSVEVGADCAAALAATRDGRARLVVIDPVECDQAQLAKLRALTEARGIPMVALTSRVTSAELDAVRADGYRAVLLKPALPSEVAEAVGQALGSGGQSRPR